MSRPRASEPPARPLEPAASLDEAAAASSELPLLRVVGGVIWRGGRVLLTRRGPGRAMQGLWEFPGGKVCPGESDVQALERELREELHLPVRVGACFHETEHIYPTFRIQLVLYPCFPGEDDPVLTEHDALAWVVPAEVLDYALTPADIPGARALMQASPPSVD